ncbi:MAG: hypothetical protein ACK41U_11170 [Paracoccus sp. (in: a-proteobacteria)]|uniref:hypothetical protein n=1 Tax=Paracoccus sp. TaxID=267 RepID=UPI003918A28A
MTTDETAAGDPASGSAEQPLATLPDQDGAPLSDEAEARQFAEAARIQARLSELAEQLTALAPRPTSRRRSKSGPGAVMTAALTDLKAELADLSALADQQRSTARQLRAMLNGCDDRSQCTSCANDEAHADPHPDLGPDGGLAAYQADLEQKLAAREVALARMADRLETLTRGHAEAKALADQRLLEVQTMTAIHERGLTDMEEARASARQLVQVRQAEVEALTAERDELLGRLDAQEQQLQTREMSLAQMAEDLRATMQARDEARTLMDQRLSDVQALTAMHERGLAEVETARTKATELAEARKAELESVTTERDDLLSHLAEQEQQLASHETSLAQLRDELQEALDARDAASTLADQRLSEVQVATEAHEREVAEFEAARAKANELAEELKARLDVTTTERDDLHARLAAQEQRLKSRESSLVQVAEQLQATVDSRDEATELAHQRQNEIRTLTAMLERRAAEIAAARKQVASTRNELAKAYSQTEEMRALAEARHAEVEGLLASTSWRVTRPMRSVASGLRSLRRRKAD